MLSVIKAGVETSLQDIGRPGLRAQGIPQSGAADRLSLAAANIALGNSWDAPALEMAMGGLSVKAQEDVRLAISGADMKPAIDGRAIALNMAVTLKAGQVLSFGFGLAALKAAR